ncbi:TetR/AcrR family transcriptional regulator C-terminal ligand-binding domain-containing protein [Mycobacterium sp. NBC_00419]|uniref:TetR-like C-terminal domain-containing protein n=1 Tax=Mycobacterium sp. NBC_00419 TaxID=2975989 RepID=UPI002E213FCA
MDWESGPTPLCQRVIAAASDELAARGIDNFTIEGVAARAGVEADAIRQVWGDRRVLLMDAPLRGAQQTIPIPDTGSLRGDLVAYADSLAAASANPSARAVLYSLIPSSKDWDPTEVRSDFWDIRFEKIATILRRAAARGELRSGVDPLEAMRMLSSALNYDALFTDSPVRPQYAEQVLDIFIAGVSREDGTDKTFPAVGLLPRIGRVTRQIRFIVVSWTWPKRLTRSALARQPKTPNASASGSIPARR